MSFTGESSLIRSVDDVDLSDIRFWNRPPADIEAAFVLLRKQRPLPFYDAPQVPGGLIESGPGYYAITRHADVVAISGQPKAFSSAAGATSVADLPEEFLDFFGSMINLDAPRHVRLRRIVSRAFTPKIIQQTEDDIAALARDIVTDLIATGPG
nr:hypothetical protein [Micromonospora sp. DSM 115978]